MKRSHGQPPLIPLNFASGSTVVPTAVREEAGSKPQDWFLIENKKNDSTADIYIYDEIGYWGTEASTFSRQLRDLDVTQINLHLNSPGGSVFDGVAIYNTLASHKARVTVYVDGLAASAASFIAQAGDEVIMLQGSTMMIHDASGASWDNADGMRKTADILDLLSDNIASIYASRAGGKATMWREIMKEEAWYSPDEAVEAGLADKVSAKAAAPMPSKDNTDEELDSWEDRWNLASMFNYAGRKAAPSPKMIRQTVINRLSKEEGSVPPITKNTEEQVTEEQVAEEQVEVAPAATPAPEAPAEEEEEAPAAPAEDAEPVPPAPVEGNPEQPENAATFVVVNGQRHTVPAAVAQHVAGLEKAQKEDKAKARVAFVDALAEDSKITGPQAESFKDFVAGLDDAQYSMWEKSWENAAPLALFGKHVTDGDATNSEDNAKFEEIKTRYETLDGIVSHLKQGGMTEAKVMDTSAYKEMQDLLKKHPGLAESGS